jgi:predicted TIM-barrel fold metal-dependent hydrolase
MHDLRKGRLERGPYYYEVDLPFFQRELEGYQPDRITDIHAHVTGPGETLQDAPPPDFWAEKVCPDGMTLQNLLESHAVLFPGKEYRTLAFPMPSKRLDPEKGNEYVSRESRRLGVPSLILTDPSWSAAELERRVAEGGFVGLKPYPSTLDKPADEIEVFDYLPEAHLALADQNDWVVILHLPRPERLVDPLNLRTLVEVDHRYPNAKVVVAHVGRAYCPRYGEGLDDLKGTHNLLFGISANTNQAVFEKLLGTVEPDRIVYGSDLPITAMHSRRVCEGDNYVNTVLDADWEDSHTRIGSPEDGITYFLYEAIWAFRRAAESIGLGREDLEKVFHGNAERILGGAKGI